jgi:hypothetical protein
MSLIASIEAGGQCGRTVVAAGVAAVVVRPACAAGGCATHGNFMFTAADCDAQRQKALNIMIAKYFCDANAEILYTKYDEKIALLMTDYGYGLCL